MADDTTRGVPPTGTSPHPSPAEGRPPEVGDPTAAREVAASGTALHRDERDSGLDLGDAPGTAGTGAGG